MAEFSFFLTVFSRRRRRGDGAHSRLVSHISRWGVVTLKCDVLSATWNEKGPFSSARFCWHETQTLWHMRRPSTDRTAKEPRMFCQIPRAQFGQNEMDGSVCAFWSAKNCQLLQVKIRAKYTSPVGGRDREGRRIKTLFYHERHTAKKMKAASK